MISLGIDIGGTGCKCVAFHENGAQLALAYMEYPNPSGNVNLNADTLRECVFDVISRCVNALENREEVKVISVSSFGESFVALDADGNALGDIILYFADSSSTAFDALVKDFGAQRMMEIARILPDPSYSLAKMLYTLETAPKPVWKFLFIAGFICWCLSGEAVSDVSLACRSLLYDVKRGAWSKELLDKSGIKLEQLPQVLATGSIAGHLTKQVAERLGLAENTQVVIGAHDQIVNALAAGVCEIGEAMDGSGTCECIAPLFAEMPGMDFVRNNFACVPYLDNAGYVTYAYNISGGSAVKWYRDALAQHLLDEAKQRGCSIYDLLNELCPSEPTKLLVLPYVLGMGGTPDVNVAATGVIAGITASTTLPDLYRGLLEGLCFEMLYNLEKLREGGVVPKRLYACGGGARSQIWLQIKADVWGCDIIPVETEETGALGSAILGFAAVKGETDHFALAKSFTRHASTISPDPERHAYYQRQYERFKKMRSFYLEEIY